MLAVKRDQYEAQVVFVCLSPTAATRATGPDSTSAPKQHHTGQNTETGLRTAGEDSHETVTPEKGAAAARATDPSLGTVSPVAWSWAPGKARQEELGGECVGRARERSCTDTAPRSTAPKSLAEDCLAPTNVSVWGIARGHRHCKAEQCQPSSVERAPRSSLSLQASSRHTRKATPGTSGRSCLVVGTTSLSEAHARHPPPQSPASSPDSSAGTALL